MESVSLEDVAVSLTQAEWDLLDPAQRLLYRDVMLEACMHLVFVEVFARGKASGAVGGDVKLLIIEDSTENLIRHDPSNGFGEKRMFPDAGDEKDTQKQEQECISLDSLGDSHKAPEGAGETRRSTQRFSEPQSPVAASPVECSSPQQPPSPPRDSPPDLAQGAVCCPAGQETPSLNPDTPQRRRRRPNIPRPKPTSHDCKVCGETFSVANLLTRHIRENHKETPYVCELCGKGFRFPSYLQAHTETHTDIEKPFKCPECPQSFRYPCKLRAHARVHMEVKPFGCKECGKSFMSSWKLRRHSWIHSGERPYDCPECGKAFHESYLLAKHMRIHTGELPYTCTQCGRGFRWLDSLQIHQVTHTSLSPFQCPECGKAYRCRSYFRVHLKTHQAAQPLK